MFTIESDVEGLDTVIYARTECTNGESELACNDDVVQGQVLLSQLRLTLEAEQSIYVVADAFSGPGIRTDRSQGTNSSIGEECDANANEVGCEANAFCRVDPEGDGASGQCAPDSAPVITGSLRTAAVTTSTFKSMLR